MGDRQGQENMFGSKPKQLQEDSLSESSQRFPPIKGHLSASFKQEDLMRSLDPLDELEA